MSISSKEFRIFMEDMLFNMKKDYLDVRSGDVHEKLGYYPGPKHTMPSLCAVMYDLMRSQDEILTAPPKGKGANLIIRYYKR